MWLILAIMMADGLKALADSPPSCRENVGIAKQAILTTAKKYFAVFDWDDEADELQGFLPLPQKQAATAATSTAPKPSNPSRKKRRENR